MMVPVLWTLYFIEEKGYTVESNIMFQDNHSTMRLILNWKKTSLNNTKHINTRYFFVTYVINRGEMSVKYFPTEEIWAEVLTKPLQGESYRITRIKLMNMPKLYVEPDKNATAKGSKAAGVFAKEKLVDFNQDVHMKYIPKITGVKTKIVNSRLKKPQKTHICTRMRAI